MNEEAPEVRRSCYDCGWLKAYVSWWCTNPEARKARGSAIPAYTIAHIGKVIRSLWKSVGESGKETVQPYTASRIG